MIILESQWRVWATTHMSSLCRLEKAPLVADQLVGLWLSKQMVLLYEYFTKSIFSSGQISLVPENMAWQEEYRLIYSSRFLFGKGPVQAVVCLSINGGHERVKESSFGKMEVLLIRYLSF